jgi:hypothetical protein
MIRYGGPKIIKILARWWNKKHSSCHIMDMYLSWYEVSFIEYSIW